MKRTLFPPWAADHVLGLPRWVKRVVAMAVDAGLCVLTVWLWYSLRFEEWSSFGPLHWGVAATSVVLALPLMVRFGLYRAIFRHSGWNAMLDIVGALGLYGLVFFGIFTVWGVDGVPRSVGVSQPLLLLVAISSTRVLVRYWLGGVYRSRLQYAQLPGVLIYGAGASGRLLANAMARHADFRLMGFVDDDAALHGHSMDGRRVYNPGDLRGLVKSLRITDVLLAMPSASAEQRNRVIERLRALALRVRTVPSLGDLVTGQASIADVRELDIEDLLGRAPVRPNGLLLNMNTRGKTVLVTGAGGSIGSELCRQILKLQPRRLLLVDMSEFALYSIHRELQMQQQVPPPGGTLDDWPPEVELVPLLASVCDELRMHEIMDTWKPHTVYHAAAYKHVPLVEHNPAEGVRNNVWGTRLCAEAAMRNGVRNFVLISTDKAVRPTNIMGATKRLAEMVLQAMSDVNPAVVAPGERASGVRTVFSMVRFGNVLGSSGSVVPLFRDQIHQGGPITLTHPEITRYFMTIPEAAQLVIQAGAMGTGGDVFVLDMGHPVRIIDLARRMVELSGLTVKDDVRPDGDIELVVTGLRPGEKLYEELLIGDNPQPTQHPRIMKAHEQFLPWPQLEQKLNALGMAVGVNDVPIIRGMLQQLVNGYKPSGEVVDWIHMVLEREALEDA